MAAGANNKQLISQLHKIDCLRFLRWYRCVAPLLWGGLVVYQGIEPGHITDSQLYILLGISAFCVLTLYRWQMLVWPELMETFELQTVAILTTGNRIDYARLSKEDDDSPRYFLTNVASSPDAVPMFLWIYLSITFISIRIDNNWFEIVFSFVFIFILSLPPFILSVSRVRDQLKELNAAMRESLARNETVGGA